MAVLLKFSPPPSPSPPLPQLAHQPFPPSAFGAASSPSDFERRFTARSPPLKLWTDPRHNKPHERSPLFKSLRASACVRVEVCVQVVQMGNGGTSVGAREKGSET